MIIWDFSVIVALGIILSLGIVIILWVFYTLSGGRTGPRGRAETLSHREFFRQCGFCGYLYFDYFKKVHGACPRCGSYQQ